MFESIALLGFGHGSWGLALLQGAFVTIALALCCLPFGLALGLLVAVGSRSRSTLARGTAYGFSTVFRGLPELLTLFLVYYGFEITIEQIFAAAHIDADVSINPFFAAFVALSVVLAAFSSEVWLGAFKSIHKGQYEAAHALGLSKSKTFFSIVLPQLLRIALPGLSNNWLTLLKDTALVSTISLVDVMRQTNLAVSETKEPILFYGAACAIYLFFSALSGRLFAFAEHHFGRGHHRARV
ncbi:ABC transporter permease [Paraburkholderia silviterrae]|uniref:ABC transporter permease subunit n=1 Tax=Paraburkholderia silviterrae TaxID=2528715 RepID=A0A4V6PJ19_9BURK|nr:ABC transporter permease subunit [Paraburkholderia silviterrae]TDG19974.1 ABC transporter permease subunit [Paraburkholderia silviterrae]